MVKSFIYWMLQVIMLSALWVTLAGYGLPWWGDAVTMAVAVLAFDGFFAGLAGEWASWFR